MKQQSGSSLLTILKSVMMDTGNNIPRIQFHDKKKENVSNLKHVFQKLKDHDRKLLPAT